MTDNNFEQDLERYKWFTIVYFVSLAIFSTVVAYIYVNPVFWDPAAYAVFHQAGTTGYIHTFYAEQKMWTHIATILTVGIIINLVATLICSYKFISIKQSIAKMGVSM